MRVVDRPICILKKFYFYFIYTDVFVCMHVCAPPACSAPGDQRKALYPLELESHIFVRLCTRNRSQFMYVEAIEQVAEPFFSFHQVRLVMGLRHQSW